MIEKNSVRVRGLGQGKRWGPGQGCLHRPPDAAAQSLHDGYLALDT
jgi:hypothetical protein